jgi:intein/homing endonuclease
MAKFILNDSPQNKKRMVAASGAYDAPTADSKNISGFAKSQVVSVPITKNAQYAGSGAGIAMTQPMFFSPLHTPQNWQIASRRREIMQWSRFYYMNEPKVAAGVDFYANFSMNGFKLECKSKKILKFYEQMAEDIDLAEKLNSVSHEYFLIGDVFPFTEIACPICGGTGRTPDGEICNHPDGTFKSIKLMNPDYIEVRNNPLASMPEYYLVADEDLKTLVQSREPKAIYEALPQSLIDLVASGQPIPLSERCISHIKHNASDYGTYGTSMLQRLFTVLAYKTKMMTANWIVAERLILPIRVVKVGDKDRPATDADLSSIQDQLSAVANDPNLTIVTHHAFEYEWFGATGKIHNITQELEQVGKEILDGLMLNQAILNGEMAGYSSAQVGIEVLIRRLDNWRNKLQAWVERKLFLPVAQMQGFIDEKESQEQGHTVYLFPKLVWNDLQLRDKTNRIQTLLQMYDKGMVSAQTVLEEMDLDYDAEVEKIRDEQVMASANGMVAGGHGGDAMGGAPMGGGMDMGGMGPMGGGEMGGDMSGMGGGDMSGAPGMGGGMGGSPAAPGMAAEGEVPMPKIGKRGSKKQEDEQQAPPPQMIKLTNLEQKMFKTLASMNVPYELFAQYQVKVPGEQRAFALDFAYPKIGVGVECFHPETYISTIEGSIMAKDIGIDQKLIGRDGSPVEIIKKYINKSKGSLINIKAMGMDGIRITDNHPLLVCKPKKIRVKRNEPAITRTREYNIPSEPKFVKASIVEEGDYLVIPKNRQVSDNYNIKEEIDLKGYKGKAYNAHKLPNNVNLDEDFGWLMGIYAAEGCSSGVKNKVVTFSFHIDEVEYSDKVQDLLKKIFNLPSSIKVDINNNCRIVVCCCTSLGRFLIDSFNHKATNKKLPSWMFESPIECKEAFLEAFCQGDGCVRENGTMRYISSSKKLMIDMQALSFSIGKFAPMCISRYHGKQVCFAGSDKKYKSGGLWEINTKPYECKNKIYREDDDYYYVPVRSIKKEKYEGDVINFETKGKGKNNHTYLSCNIVTHNCDGAIWHEREDFQQRDLNRDQKLANVGWRILRFNEDAVNENMGAVQKVIEQQVEAASKSQKKAEEDGIMIKEASVSGENSQYEYCLKTGKIGCKRETVPHGQILLIGNLENETDT